MSTNMVGLTILVKVMSVSLGSGSEQVDNILSIGTLLRGPKRDIAGRGRPFRSLRRPSFDEHPDPGTARCPIPRCRRLLRTDAMEQHYDAAHGGEA